MSFVSPIPAAIIAAVTQIVALVVAFGVIDNTTAGIVISAATATVNAAFLIANAMHAHTAVIAAQASTQLKKG